MRFIYHQEKWPQFYWQEEALTELRIAVRYQQGKLLGRMAEIDVTFRAEAGLQAITEDVVKSSEIEGERLDRARVRSSIARRLNLEAGGAYSDDRHIDGVVEMLLDATQNCMTPLTAERLYGWHAALFPMGWSGRTKIRVGQWRDDALGPMQVISGAMGKEKVHFEAPAAVRVDQEMQQFLDWVNAINVTDGAMKAAIAHFWFVIVHPFDDGNGRIARAITDLLLARSEKNFQRFYSMSSQIMSERAAYYRVLERAQGDSLDITQWLVWFLSCLGRAIEGSETLVSGVLIKARCWRSWQQYGLNLRQQDMLNRLLDGFRGKMTLLQWMKLNHCSQKIAEGDLEQLVVCGVLQKHVGARSAWYTLIRPNIGEAGWFD